MSGRDKVDYRSKKTDNFDGAGCLFGSYAGDKRSVCQNKHIDWRIVRATQRLVCFNRRRSCVWVS